MRKRSLLFLCFAAFIAILLFSFTSNRLIKKRSLSSTDTLPFLMIRAKDHLGKSVSSNSGVVTFTTGLHNDYYQVDSLNKSGFLYIETRLSSFMNDHVKRVPLNICIVIDRSGSMGGVKLGFAKKAAKGIIDQLKTEDIVSVVMYDNAVDSVQPPVAVLDKAAIQKKIDGITARGGTDLWGGTEKGYEFVQRNYKPGFINRVLLISDGLANVGMTDPQLIRLKVQQYKDDNGITLSTFGVGLDYNESLMTDMAETGLGNYYFIDAPDMMASIFTKELNGMMNVAAQDAELRVDLPQGVKLVKSYPLKFTQNGNAVTIKMRDLFSEETRGTLFTFTIDNGTSQVLKFSSTLTYTDIADGQAKTLHHENLLSPIRNIDAYLTHFNKPVIEQSILYTANENLEKAMSEMDRGNYTSASNYIDANNSYLRANDVYVRASYELKKMDSANRSYGGDIRRMKDMGTDSIKRVQKRNKEMNYYLRQKKQ